MAKPIHIAAGALMLAAGIALPLAAGQQARSPVQMRDDLDRLRDQIAALESRLGELGERRRTLNDEFEAADIELALGRQRLEVVRIRLRVLGEEALERQKEVERLSTELDAARRELAGRVVALYRMGPLSYSRILLTADSPGEILANYQTVGRLAAQDRSLVASIRTRLVQHETAVAQLGATRERLAATRDDESRAVTNLAAQQVLRRELIRQIDIDAAAGRQDLTGREEDAAALERLLGDVGGSTPFSGEGATRPAFATARGSLPWPAAGQVTRSFGRKRHPVYDTYTIDKGIEIGAEAGAPVRAVYQGRVAYADWYQSYGLMVIVGHGDEYFTIYGHLDRVNVRPGDWVDAGGVLGTVGETGSLSGPSLYFEIREGPDAVNPAGWLQRR